MNALILYGEIKDIKDSPAEFLHNELSHFWRILGWEELTGMTQQIKHIPGTIDDVEINSGNLIRTLTLLTEYWTELGIGPKLVNPDKDIKTTIESNDGYSCIKQLNYPYAAVIVTGRDQGHPKTNGKKDYKEKAQLFEQLLAKFPAEFAFLIFEYYAFAKGWSTENYNIAVTQEYFNDEGKRKIKGYANGRFVFLLSHGNKTSIIINSDSQVPVGSPDKINAISFDTEVEAGSILSIVHGETARFISRYPDICQTLTGNKNQLINLSSALGIAHEKKPIITIPLGKAMEKQTVAIGEDEINQTLGEAIKFVRRKKIKKVSLEAGHIHADRKATNLQKLGITIGAKFAAQLESMGIDVKKQPMIDEDHVVNTLDYSAYLNLMHSLGYNAEELIFESSPVIREIAIAAIVTLFSQYPENFSLNGNALIFNIPNTPLQVEFIKDIKEQQFELGCVIFDVGLSLYRVYPELARLYSDDTGQVIHKGMFDVYQTYQNPSERLLSVKSAFPPKTVSWQEVESILALPQLPKTEFAICNILEGFYTPQQIKLVDVLKTLGVSLPVIGVSITDQGLKVNIIE